MNSVLQCLLNTPGEFEGALRRAASSPPPHASQFGVMCMLVQLMESYKGAGSVVEVRAVRRFREALARVDSRYAAGAQQDAGEFMGKLSALYLRRPP